MFHYVLVKVNIIAKLGQKMYFWLSDASEIHLTYAGLEKG